MTVSKILGYLCNCFWLLLPILVFNMLFMRQLPAAFQLDAFWKDIPRAIGVPENLLRILVMMLPFFMRLQVSTSSQKVGLGIYLMGLPIYFASWAVLIVFPQCAWGTNAIGFMAPAYTPIVWLAGIGLVGNEFQFSSFPFNPWLYWTLSALFLLFHNLHTYTVYSRSIGR